MSASVFVLTPSSSPSRPHTIMFDLTSCIAVMIPAVVTRLRTLSSNIAGASVHRAIRLRGRLTQREEPIRNQRLAFHFSRESQTTSLINLRPPDESPIMSEDLPSRHSHVGQSMGNLLAAFGRRWIRIPSISGVLTICLLISFLLAQTDGILFGSVSTSAEPVLPSSSRIFNTAITNRLPTSIPFRTSHQCDTSAVVCTTANEVHWLSILSGLRSAYTAVPIFTNNTLAHRAVITAAKEHWSTSKGVGSINILRGCTGKVLAPLATTKGRAPWPIHLVSVVGYILVAHENIKTAYQISRCVYPKKLQQPGPRYVLSSLRGPPPLKPIPTTPDVPDDHSSYIHSNAGHDFSSCIIKILNVIRIIGNILKKASTKGPLIPPITTPPDDDISKAQRQLFKASYSIRLDVNNTPLALTTSRSLISILLKSSLAWRSSCIHHNPQSRIQ